MDTTAKSSNGGSRPVPDPTELTTRAVALATAQYEQALQSLKENLMERFVASEKRVDKLQVDLNGISPQIELQVRHLREVVEEMFCSVDTRFVERDTRTEQTSRDSKVAVDAALQAQKESVNAQNMSNSVASGKMENSFTKQIDALVLLITSTSKASDEKIDDIKQRQAQQDATLLAFISKGVGATETKDHARESNNMTISIIVGAAIVLSAVVGLMVAIMYHH